MDYLSRGVIRLRHMRAAPPSGDKVFPLQDKRLAWACIK